MTEKGQVREMTSIEVRKLISNAHNEGMSVNDMVKAYRVSKSTLYKLLAQEKNEGAMNPHTDHCGRPPAINPEGLEQMKDLILMRPDITLEELKEELQLSICVSAIHRIIRNKLGFSYKKRQYMPVNEIVQMS